jgi:ribulose-5-phosphate 4-epimerase/fuculose-1-phosphate aldolase
LTELEPDQEFADFLIEVGSDFSLTQGLGGNSSIKSKGVMLVKASGKRLGHSSLTGYFYQVGVSEGEHYELNPLQPGKPSIEVFLHALLPHKYVVHLHSTQGVALSMLSAGDENLRVALENQGVSIIEYRRPGVQLKEAIKHKLQSAGAKSKSTTFLLQNHGTLFGANSVTEIREAVTRFENNASIWLGTGTIKLVNPDNLQTVFDECEASQIKWHAENNWRLSPDHVVFLGASSPPSLLQVLSGATSVHNILKSVFPNLKNIGPKEEQLLWFLNVVQYLPKSHLLTIDEEESRALISWEAEQHRVKSAFNK